MFDMIKLSRHRNIRMKRHEAGDVLTVGKDLTQGLAETLVRIGNAEWHKPKKNKSAKLDLETK